MKTGANRLEFAPVTCSAHSCSAFTFSSNSFIIGSPLLDIGDQHSAVGLFVSKGEAWRKQRFRQQIRVRRSGEGNGTGGGLIHDHEGRREQDQHRRCSGCRFAPAKDPPCAGCFQHRTFPLPRASSAGCPSKPVIAGTCG